MSRGHGFSWVISRSFIACLLVALLTSAAAAQTIREVMMPMRDGVKLGTNVSIPDGEGPWPVVLSRTPYGKGAANRADTQYTARGYVRVSQDVRGKGKSEGVYRAFQDDMQDGYDTVEWIAAQPWCNGKVGMIGTSAPANLANLAAMASPPHLVCSVLTLGHGSSYRYSSYPGGAYLQNLSEEWLKAQGVPPSPDPRPLQRPYDDAAHQLDIQTYLPNMNVKTLNIGGWYDIFSQGNIDCFTGLQTNGGPQAKGNQKLIVGAFGHGRLQGSLSYPAEASNRSAEAGNRWLDHWLKGADNGIEREPAVRYYVMGDTFDKKAPGNEWRTSDVWPVKAETTPYYLHAGHRLSTTAPNVPAGSADASDSLVYDPKDPVPSVGGNNLNMAIGPMDQRKVSGRPDVLKFETEPLTEAVEIVGRIFAELQVSTDAEDTDFMVKLIDVYPDGYEALMLDEAFRLRYYAGPDKMTKVEKGKVYPIKVDLWSTALVFNKGHKIAIHVSSSNAPRFEKHSNTWESLRSYDDAVKAINTVHHDGAHASKLLLPVTKIYPADYVKP